MKGAKRKLLSIAVVVLVITSGLHCFNQDASTVKDLNLSEEESGAENIPTSKFVPLNIELPQPLFGSHRSANFRDLIPNLEPWPTEARQAFLVPAGTKNVALGKPVSASDHEPIIGRLEMMTDGDKEAADRSYIELEPDVRHVTIDLEGEYEIYAIAVWHYHRQPRAYFDVIVQVADDSDFCENVRTLFNNDHDNSAGLGAGEDRNYVETYKGKLIDANGVRGRYVRLYSNGNDINELNHYIEVEVYGKAIKYVRGSRFNETTFC
jgi:hypothetical protein